jgi:hypothetical protein
MEDCALTLTTGIPAAAANCALFKPDFFYITVFAKVPFNAPPAAEVSTAFMSNSGTRCPKHRPRSEIDSLRVHLKHNAVKSCSKNRRSHLRVRDFLCATRIAPSKVSRFDLIGREPLKVAEDILWQLSDRGRIESQ